MPETNLQVALDTMHVLCDDKQYVFVTTNNNSVTTDSNAIATFQEDEGTTLVLTTDQADKQKLSYNGVLAKLTINIHTSLELVGLTAALATALGEKDIPSNVIAAYYHDHIFVPYDKRQVALKTLQQLKG